jgi:DtxR family Mn-dependent transcriptional regulator
MPWHAVYEEAERLEHVISPAFEQKLLEKLGKETPCPHGNLAMQGSAERRRQGLCLLNEAAVNGGYQIASVFEHDRQLLEMLDQEGIRPGAQIVLQSKNYDGTATLRIGNKSLRLGGTAAKKIWVKKA